MTLTFTPLAPLQTAVLFLVFNRPYQTAQVFEAIRRAKPPRFYIAADGPRDGRKGDAGLVAKVREIATAVDWPCEVRTLFRKENLGCKNAVSAAITWFFANEDQGIILEEDCLPDQSFFWFCEELLNRYADDPRVSCITGNNFQAGQHPGEPQDSYYFSKYNHCWGWATWRRAWQHYQGDLPFWPGWSKSDVWLKHTEDRVERRYWDRIFKRVRAGQIDSWAYPWTASVWYQGGLTATPNVNMVSNIGFGKDSTHTVSPDSPLAGMATSAIGEIIHPNTIAQDQDADRFVFDHTFDGKGQRFPRSLLRVTLRAGGFLYRSLRRSIARCLP